MTFFDTESWNISLHEVFSSLTLKSQKVRVLFSGFRSLLLRLSSFSLGVLWESFREITAYIRRRRRGANPTTRQTACEREKSHEKETKFPRYFSPHLRIFPLFKPIQTLFERQNEKDRKEALKRLQWKLRARETRYIFGPKAKYNKNKVSSFFLLVNKALATIFHCV